MSQGICYLVGAGPGDPGLLTLRGKACLERAEVIVYDYLSNPELLRFAQFIESGYRAFQPPPASTGLSSR